MKRLTYISHVHRELGNDELVAIEKTSVSNNSRDGLTGALFSFKGFFFQIVEGNETLVDACFGRISKDPRHTEVVVTQVENDISARDYPDWAMKIIPLDENTDLLMKPVKSLLASLAANHRILERYTSGFVQNRVREGTNPLTIPMRRTEAVVVFSDIVGSTVLGESLSPVQTIRLLRVYYDIAGEAIESRGGEILKLTGDGFMARFDAGGAEQAFASCEDAIVRLSKLRDRSPPDDPVKFLCAGFGLTRGPVLEGNIGSGSRSDYTLLGDAVNSAARLEAATRRFRQCLIFDENVYLRLKNPAEAVKIGKFRPSGKAKSMVIYGSRLSEAHMPFVGDDLRAMARPQAAVLSAQR